MKIHIVRRIMKKKKLNYQVMFAPREEKDKDETSTSPTNRRSSLINSLLLKTENIFGGVHSKKKKRSSMSSIHVESSLLSTLSLQQSEYEIKKSQSLNLDRKTSAAEETEENQYLKNNNKSINVYHGSSSSSSNPSSSSSPLYHPSNKVSSLSLDMGTSGLPSLLQTPSVLDDTNKTLSSYVRSDSLVSE
mmetsp:Transcript_50524/g.64740  ORF Transcript_50524/g.64740 Transcript_50524/m.64740 type:complete len:190 (-) Transcript_50524:3-572(-)